MCVVIGLGFLGRGRVQDLVRRLLGSRMWACGCIMGIAPLPSVFYVVVTIEHLVLMYSCSLYGVSLN